MTNREMWELVAEHLECIEQDLIHPSQTEKLTCGLYICNILIHLGRKGEISLKQYDKAILLLRDIFINDDFPNHNVIWLFDDDNSNMVTPRIIAAQLLAEICEEN